MCIGQQHKVFAFKVRLAGLILETDRVLSCRAGFKVYVDGFALRVVVAIVDTQVEGLRAPKLTLVFVALNHASLGGSQLIEFFPVLLRANL